MPPSADAASACAASTNLRPTCSYREGASRQFCYEPECRINTKIFTFTEIGDSLLVVRPEAVSNPLRLVANEVDLREATPWTQSVGCWPRAPQRGAQTSVFFYNVT